MLGSALAVVCFMYVCDSCNRVHDVDGNFVGHTFCAHSSNLVTMSQKGGHRCRNESAGTASI